MSCTLVLKRTFRELESCLLHDLENSCAENPFARKWVLTSSGTLARHVRMRLKERIKGRTGVSLGGLRIVSLSHFSVEIYKRIERGRPFSSFPLNDILLDALIRRIPDSSPLAPVRAIDSGYSLLLPTFRDLADAGFGPGHAEVLLDTVRERGVSEREKRILELYFAWVGAVKSQDKAWSPLCQQDLSDWIEQAAPEEVSAALSSESGQPAGIFVYGFYDFTDNNLQILAGLSRSQDLSIYFPDNRRGKASHPAFDFSASVLDDIRVRMGPQIVRGPLRELQEKPASPAADFFDQTFPDGNPEEQPGFLTFQRASSPRAEALSAALRIRRWIDELGIEPGEIMVVLTSPGGYLGPALEVFEEFCLPVNLLDCPVELSRTGLRQSVLGRLWRESAPAEWVFQYLRDNPGFCEEQGIDAFHFESKLREAVFGGGPSWQAVRRLARNGSRGEKPALRLSREESELIGLIVSTWVEKPVFPISPEQAVSLLQKISLWLRGDEKLDPVIESFRNWGLVRPGSEITESLFFSLVFRSFGPEATKGDVEAPGVKLVPMMRARGMTCRAMVLMGLSSGVFPRKIEEDYFLADHTRAEVVKRSGVLGHRMAVKSRLTDEMALLFYLLNTSAEIVHWVIPETDSAGRLVTPTSWTQNYLQHWEAGQPPSLRRIAPALTEQARFLQALDPEKGSFLPPGMVFLLGNRQAERISGFADLPPGWSVYRKGSGPGPEYYGQVRDAAFPGRRNSLGVTSIEKLARCPFKFYAEKMLEAAPLEEQVYPDTAGALEKGSMLHSALEHLLRGHKDAAAAFREILSHPGVVKAAVEKAVPGTPSAELLPPLFRSVLIDQLAGIILEYLVFADENTPPGRSFSDFEVHFEQPFPGLPEVTLKGIADRIDQDKETGNLHITDYKSGKNRDLEVKKNRAAVLDLGWMAQASLYRWMLAGRGERGEIGFSYVFLGEPKEKDVPADPSFSAERILESLESILSGGNYLPSENSLMEDYGLAFLEPCNHCDYMSLCRRVDPEQRTRMAELFRANCRERGEYIRNVADRNRTA